MIQITATKPWWQSKTMWFGIIEAAVGGVMLYEDYLTEALEGSIVAWVLLGSGIAKMVLRAITNTQVDLPKPTSILRKK